MKIFILFLIVSFLSVPLFGQVKNFQMEAAAGPDEFVVSGASGVREFQTVSDVKTLLGIPSGGVYTDDQNISGSGLSGTTLTIGIEGGSNETVNFTGWDTDASDDFSGSWNDLTDIPIDIADGDDDTQLSQEEVQDFVGPMVSGNTETLISVTYDDAGNEFNFIVEDDLSLYDNSTSGFLTSEVDGSITNEAQSLNITGATDPTIELTAANGSGGGSFDIVGGTGVDVSQVGGVVTIDALTSGESTSVTDGNTINFTLTGTNITGEVILNDPLLSSTASGIALNDDLSQYDNTTSGFLTSGDLNDDDATNELQDLDVVAGTNIDDGSLTLNSSSTSAFFETEQFGSGPFTLSNTPVFIFSVHRNGVYQELTDDYTVSGSTISLVGTAFGGSEELTVVYVHE